MVKKLAVVISGAVSLGSYEAGVMYELLQAFASHNAADPDNSVFIDVITGASAGGMNAVILAQKLLFRPSRLQDPADNDLFLPWVKDVDLSGLLSLKSDESSQLSILSSDLIDAISQRYLIGPYQSGINMQPEGRHPAAAKRIKLGLAMSNLNGIDYGLNLLSGGQMPYTRFQDEVKIEVDSDEKAGHNTADFWEPIRSAAVGCGAFPFAFRVRDLLRHTADYADPKPLRFPLTGMHFAYTDGGTFQNEPIGLAKQLVDEIDQHLNVADERYYLFVAPGMRQSACNDFSAAPGSNYFNYWNTGKALINAIFNQARYRDLENVEMINSQVAVFDQQADELMNVFLKGAATAATINPATTPLLNLLFPKSRSSAKDQATARLKTQFAAEFKKISDAKDQAEAEAWLNAVLLLETVASLGSQDKMCVYAITEDAEKLAGDDLFAFGGFFDVSYRQHDYDRGRQSVRDFIVWLNQQTEPGMGPIRYQIAGLPPLNIDAALDGVKLQAISKDKRHALYKQLHDRIDDFMEELGITMIIREGLFVGYLDRYLTRILGL